MGSLDTKNGLELETYSIPYQAKKLLEEGIINNPLISKELPTEAAELSKKVKYVGSDLPSIPINWRFAESIASLKGLEATVLNCLLARKYGIEPQEVVINTDHAQLFFMSVLLWTIDPHGQNIKPQSPAYEKYFPSRDIFNAASSFHRSSATNIYRTSDNKFFHLHGSMNPNPSLDSLGLPYQLDAPTVEESWKPFAEKMSKIESTEMQRLATDEFKQAGTICWTQEEFLASEHYKANSHIGLFEIHHQPNSLQKPCWWPSSPETSVKRPLAGLKVLDICRIIAGPAISRGLAEMGASVMRVVGPDHLPDLSTVNLDLGWGKWQSKLDFRDEGDREKLRMLVRDADVVVTGYRPGVLDKYGFGVEGILKICEGRERGVVFARENCYGWNGPWKDRSGWQQISDACCGVSMSFGQAMGKNEPVTPVFPNSDYCTGVAGTTGILTALIRRAENGGSYIVDTALNYYSTWLVKSCGTYPEVIWQDVWKRNGKQIFRHYHNMMFLLPKYLLMLVTNARNVVLKEGFFEDVVDGALGVVVRTVKPIVGFPEGRVRLGYNVGTRANGVDVARWPKDLTVEIVTDSN